MSVGVRALQLLSILVILALPTRAATLRIGTYNLENYVDQAIGTRAAKSAESKAKVRESIRAMNPDVLAVQEMGSVSALQELSVSLKAEGLDFPHWEHVRGYDTNVHVAVLSKFPFKARRPHTNDNFLLGGRRFRVSRGFAEVEIEITPKYSFTLLTAHLKSKRAVFEADEAELRFEEAKLLREKVDKLLSADPQANVIVLGDLNDTKDAASTKALIGRGRDRLVDTRPAERNGDTAPNTNSAWDPRNVTWTHYYGVEDSYSRIDYVLLSTGMAKELVPAQSYVVALPNWGVASDHRPLVVTFTVPD